MTLHSSEPPALPFTLQLVFLEIRFRVVEGQCWQGQGTPHLLKVYPPRHQEGWTMIRRFVYVDFQTSQLHPCSQG